MGGLARKATVIDNIRAEGYDALIVDAGNLFFAKNQLSPGITTDIAKINAETILKAFNVIGCDAFSPGSQDFALGVEYLKEMENEANFPFISANIYNSNGNAIFDPYIISMKDEVNVGYIGLASLFNHPDLLVSDPLNILPKIVDEMRLSCELVVLLFNGTDSDLVKIQKSDIPIDLIIRSKSKRGSRDGGGKRIPVYSAGEKGKKVYEIDVVLESSGEKIIDIGNFENKMDKIQKRLDRMKTDNVMTMEELYQKYINDSNITQRIKEYEKQITEAKEMVDIATNTINLKIHELDKHIADKPTILKIVDYGKEQIAEMKGPPLPDSKGRSPDNPHHGHNH